MSCSCRFETASCSELDYGACGRDAQGGNYAGNARVERRAGLAPCLHYTPFVEAVELDSEALLERIANVLGDCLAVGSLNRKTGALSASLPRAEIWAAALARAGAGAGAVFPGVRLAAVAAVLNNIADTRDRAAKLEHVSVAAEGARIVFQRCPWDERDALFVVLPADGGEETNFALLRLVLESVRRDVAIVRAPRVEARCWN